MSKKKKREREELLSKLSEEDRQALQLGIEAMRRQRKEAPKKWLIDHVEKIINFIFDLEE